MGQAVSSSCSYNISMYWNILIWLYSLMVGMHIICLYIFEVNAVLHTLGEICWRPCRSGILFIILHCAILLLLMLCQLVWWGICTSIWKLKKVRWGFSTLRLFHMKEVTDPTNKLLLAGTVLTNNLLLAGTPPGPFLDPSRTLLWPLWSNYGSRIMLAGHAMP